jgi:hypothetical protein
VGVQTLGLGTVMEFWIAMDRLHTQNGWFWVALMYFVVKSVPKVYLPSWICVANLGWVGFKLHNVLGVFCLLPRAS